MNYVVRSIRPPTFEELVIAIALTYILYQWLF